MEETIQWEKVGQGRAPAVLDQIERAPPDAPRTERETSPQSGPTPPAGPVRVETGQIRPHIFTEVLDSARVEPLEVSFPKIFDLLKD